MIISRAGRGWVNWDDPPKLAKLIGFLGLNSTAYVTGAAVSVDFSRREGVHSYARDIGRSLVRRRVDPAQ